MALPVQLDLAEALRETIEASKIGQVELAKRLNEHGWEQVDQPLISKWVTRKREIPLDVVPQIEELLGARRGTILTLAGFVDPAETVEARVAADSSLTPRYRGEVISYYEYVRERSTQDAR